MLYGFFCTFLYVPSSFAIILMGKRELVALLSLFSWCLVIVVWIFLAVPLVSLQFVIVVFPDHTHLLFLEGHLYLGPLEIILRILAPGKTFRLPVNICPAGGYREIIRMLTISGVRSIGIYIYICIQLQFH